MHCSDIWTDLSENPLETLIPDGGFCGIFRTIGCIGDSLSSGELESDESDTAEPQRWHDYFEYSWGQYIGRMTGAKVYNFSRGGMTAQEYCETFASQYGYWDPQFRCQAYTMALGVNDLFWKGAPLGSMEDICMADYRQNAPTFTGCFAKIIQRLRSMEPHCRFFLLTMPEEPSLTQAQKALADGHASIMHQLAERFPDTYVIDLRKYGPVYDEEFKKRFYLRGHMNPAGYLLTAKMVATYMDHIIRSNLADFSQVGFIGTAYYLD